MTAIKLHQFSTPIKTRRHTEVKEVRGLSHSSSQVSRQTAVNTVACCPSIPRLPVPALVHFSTHCAVKCFWQSKQGRLFVSFSATLRTFSISNASPLSAARTLTRAHASFLRSRRGRMRTPLAHETQSSPTGGKLLSAGGDPAARQAAKQWMGLDQIKAP